MIAVEPFQPSRPANGLKPGQIEVIKATVPVLAEHGAAITACLYSRMLAARPELKNIFNSAHQSTGDQPAALAHAVWAYAANIDNLAVLEATVTRIAHKHASLGVAPDQYNVVGEHLLAAIKEVLGDAATDPILDAWAAAYQQLADLFIATEQKLYTADLHAKAGWNGWRKFEVVSKVAESNEITSFYLEPVDRTPLPVHQPGQYISIRLFVPQLGVYQPRQYTLSQCANGRQFRISVKRESSSPTQPAGKISNVLHQNLVEGETLDVSMPHGDFTLDLNSDKPVILVSGGVGITPMLAMLGTLTAQAKQRQVLFVHAARNGNVRAMKEYINEAVAQSDHVDKAIFYHDVNTEDVRGVDYDFQGRLDFEKIRDQVLIHDADYYLCGPLGFMQAQQQKLQEMGVQEERIHTEVFGSGIVQ